MNTATTIPQTLAGTSWGYDVRAALRELSSKIDGVADIRLQRCTERHEGARHKVYFVLATHDLRRDARVVELMGQFEDVDYDLVPESSMELVPRAARSVL